MTVPTDMHDGMILSALERLHPQQDGQWIFVQELRIGTGYKEYQRMDCDQRIDAYALNTWPSRRYERIAYEVKISRGDFLRELAKPAKRRAAMRYSNRFYFAVPAGLIKGAELPDDCGLVTVEDGIARVRIPAPWRDVALPDWSFVASLARTYAKHRCWAVAKARQQAERIGE